MARAAPRRVPDVATLAGMTALERLDALATAQHGAVSRAQALSAGLTPAGVRSQLAARRWQRVLPGVYVTYTGPVRPMTSVWAALLYAGEGAVAAGRTAAWLHGVDDDLRQPVQVIVPASRRVRDQKGVVVRTCEQLEHRRHPAASPPRLRVEETVLDLVGEARRAQDVVDLVIRACQRGRTTPRRLREAVAARRRLRWRELLADVLAEAADGVWSELERRYARGVERAHGLPRGTRNAPDTLGGRTAYRDVRYRRWRAVIELDGRAAHPAERVHLDRARDRELAVHGDVTLRFGWREVVGSPCDAAAQVAALLATRGWRGTPRACGPGCSVAAAWGRLRAPHPA